AWMQEGGRMAADSLQKQVSSLSRASRRERVGVRVMPRDVAGLRRVGGDLQADDLVLRRGDHAVGIAVAALDLVDEVHAVHDLAPDGVLPVEEGGVGKADEELAVGAVGMLG